MKSFSTLFLFSLLTIAAPYRANSAVTVGKAPALASGKIVGSSFKPTHVEVILLGRSSVRNGNKTEYAETFHMTFREGKDIFPDKEVFIALQQPAGTKLSGLKISQKASKMGSALYEKQFYSRGNSLAHGVIAAHYTLKKPGQANPKTDFSMEAPEVSIVFGTQKGNKITGNIDITINKGQAMLHGQFTATIIRY